MVGGIVCAGRVFGVIYYGVLIIYIVDSVFVVVGWIVVFIDAVIG